MQAMEAIKRYSTMAFNRTGFALVQQLEQAVDQLDELGGLDGVDEVTTVDTSQGGDFPLLSSMTRMASELTDGDVEDLETASQPTYFDEEDMQVLFSTACLCVRVFVRVNVSFNVRALVCVCSCIYMYMCM